MKHISILIASFLFSLLFFDKSIGLNLSIFSIITIVFLGFYNLKAFKNQRIRFYTLAYIITAIFVFVQHSGLSIIANCIAFFTLVGAISEQNTSIYVNWLNGMFTTIAAFFYRYISVNGSEEKVDWKKNIDILHLAKLIGIPLVFIIVFVLLYKNGNPVFNDLINTISFDFINFQWVLFTILGYYLFSNISKPVQIEPITSQDKQITDKLYKSEHFSEVQLKKEKQLGTTLLGLLNLLILLYIATDVTYLITTNATTGTELSSQVHNGINTLIASIFIAIVIILYFFRGNLNFYSENKILKNLTYVWIILNVCLIGLIAIKNQNYIALYGLTYKRIGVYVYILLTCVGLITTFLKVLNIKNMVYLFRINTQIAFILLIVFSTINWDHTITKYNLNTAQNFDISYLINLSNRNAVLLYEQKDNIIASHEHKKRIDTKYWSYVEDVVQNEWQEYSYETFVISKKTSKLRN
ncbi:DUF4173 domain-containing protein [Psychroserpens algicola]|uniref:DUF4173 domain-containing protein n=1 Tax=Psychroserpens algicola TaxID=1719034 RepID=A0ABT0H704_9FLAO|nr:DUF4173 domain-containing protein [Psychroserpens algicola]MCK8480146.1 DUF4173 domain-containing protein [Psychroserpens algicola]